MWLVREPQGLTGKEEDMDQPTDAHLIRASLLDPTTFAAIFDRHAATLLGYLSRRVGRHDAEDLLSELFRIAFESRSRYDLDRPNALPWLYGIAANLVMKRSRTAARERRAFTRLSVVSDEDLVLPFDEQIVGDAANCELLAAVRTTIDDLPAADREVLVLYAWQELSYVDIAEALDLPVGTVRSRLNRVRTTLRELRTTIGQEPDIQPQRADGGAPR